MKTLIKATFITLALSFTTLYAGSGHDHSHGAHGHSHDAPMKDELSKKSIQKIAKQEVQYLSNAKKIDNSWLVVPIKNMKKTQYNYNNEWVVSFDNLKIKDKTKQTLYIFVNLYGKVTGVNYTGK